MMIFMTLYLCYQSEIDGVNKEWKINIYKRRETVFWEVCSFCTELLNKVNTFLKRQDFTYLYVCIHANG